VKVISSAHLVTSFTLTLNATDITPVMEDNQRTYGSVTEICSSILFTTDAIGKNRLTVVIVFDLEKVKFPFLEMKN
jgi:hypothetical protein